MTLLSFQNDVSLLEVSARSKWGLLWAMGFRLCHFDPELNAPVSNRTTSVKWQQLRAPSYGCVKKQQIWSIFCPILPDFRKYNFIEISQPSPACPSYNRSVKKNMNMEHWWNDTDGGKTEVLGTEICPSNYIVSPRFSHGLAWARIRIPAVKGQRQGTTRGT